MLQPIAIVLFLGIFELSDASAIVGVWGHKVGTSRSPFGRLCRRARDVYF